MPIGPIALVLLLVAAAFGLADGPLRRIGVGARGAALLLGLMLAGSTVTVAVPGLVLVNLGAVIMPLLIAIALLTAETCLIDLAWGLLGITATAAAVFLVGRYFPPGVPTELNLFYMDAQYLYALVGGLVGYLCARSGRSALGATILGVLLADMLHLFFGIPEYPLTVGGGWLQHTPLLAGMLALTLLEWVNDPVLTATELEREEETGHAGDLP